MSSDRAHRDIVLCIPGLGGHPSVFDEYKELLPEFRLRTIELVQREKGLADARAAVQEEGPVTLFCHCYASQMGIQLAQEMPDKVKGLILVEPVFAEFQPWTKLLWPVNVILLSVATFTDLIGLRRKRFRYQPDYVALSRYPAVLQPLFDIRWQNVSDYLDKCWDVLTYRLPPRVEVPTTFIFAPDGYSQNPETRARIQKIFTRARVVELSAGDHGALAKNGNGIAAAVREALGKAG